MHQAGTSVSAAGSSASTAMTDPIGTSLMRWASMMIGIGHLRPRASMVTSGPSSAPSGDDGGSGGGVVAAAGGDPAPLRPNQRLLMTSHPRPQ